MFNLGTFAGGLAHGLRSGGEMEIRRKAAERLAKADDREAQMHEASMDKSRFKQDKRERLRAANEEIVSGWEPEEEGWTVAPANPGLDLQEPGFANENSLAPAETRLPSLPAAGLSGAGGLPPKLPAASGLSDTSADETIGRHMLTGNLLEDSDELTRMANIYKKHGLMEEMTPWMNKAWDAKKKRIPDALHFLLAGDAQAARRILEKGGIKLTDDPEPIKQNGPQSPRWHLRFEDGGQQEIDLKELMGKFFPSSTFNSY